MGCDLDKVGRAVLLGDIPKGAGIAPPVRGLPDGVEAVLWKQENGRKALFLLNHAKTPAVIPASSFSCNLLTGEPVWGEWTLGGYETAVLG